MANRVNVTRATTRGWQSLAACVAFISTIANGAPDTSRKIDFELTGKVFDKQTKQPIGGAYVLASYWVAVADPAVMTTWCVKTRGIYTDEGGNFRFPVEKRDGYSPHLVSAIKPDYVLSEMVKPDPAVWKRQNAEAYAGRIIYLTKRNPSHLDVRFGYGDEYCNRAATREDAAAGVEFMKIRLSERLKHGVPKDVLEAGWEGVRRLEALPSASSTAAK